MPQDPRNVGSYGYDEGTLYRGEGGSRGFLVVLLVLACVGGGGLLAWGLKEREARARLTERNRRAEDAYTFVLAKRNDLASFLVDPRTKLFRLEGRGDSQGKPLTIAWQEQTNSGVLVGDSMPLPGDGMGYVVWLLPGGGGGRAVRCEGRLGGAGLFRPEAGMTCFEFRALDVGAGAVEGFRVTQEQSSKGAGGPVVYESAVEERA
jgi:hypothetical protein